MAWLTAIAGLAGSGGGGGGGGGGGEGGGEDSGVMGTGISSQRISQGGMIGDWAKYAREKRERAQAQREERARAAAENAATAYAIKQQEKRHDMLNDLETSQDGPGLASYLSGDQIMMTDVESFGPALKQLLQASQGYQPWMEDDPIMNQISSGRQMVKSTKRRAERFADEGIADWEKIQQNRAAAYNRDATALEEERLRRNADFEAKIGEERAGREADQARMIVETWIASNDTHSLPQKGSKYHQGRDWMEGKGINDRKFQHAKTSSKRAMIDDMLASGMTYEDLLADPEFIAIIGGDKTVGQYATAWSDEY